MSLKFNFERALVFMVHAPLGGSEFLGSLGVDGHGPVHAAGEALLQQQLCDVAILP